MNCPSHRLKHRDLRRRPRCGVLENGVPCENVVLRNSRAEMCWKHWNLLVRNTPLWPQIQKMSKPEQHKILAELHAKGVTPPPEPRGEYENPVGEAELMERYK